ncbi:MAG: glycoside hydrolase TIM-barrel-like domain-containing protein, partial [Pseudomonadota bacterium]
AGGENYDWYYASDADRTAQIRTPIVDGYTVPANQAPATTPDYALGAGAGPSFATPERQGPMVLRVALTMPAVLSGGLIFEAGGGGRGLWLGLRDGGATLRLRAGDGGALPHTGAAVLDVPTAALEGRSLELMAWIERPGDTVHLFIDGVAVGSATAPAGFSTNEWAGSNNATVATAGGSITSGEPNLAFPGSLDGPVEIWMGEAPVLGAGTPIDEAWIYRPKDLVGWWSNPHHDRVDGVRAASATAWQPGMKPIWLTETGCPAVDLGANRPNLFLDPKSSESALPEGSTGARDDEMQRRYLQAKLGFWGEAANNPVSGVYGDVMLPADRVYVWTWDARPWPDFPNRTSYWADGPNHRRGHWLTGRVSASGLAEVVAALCRRAGLEAVDVADLQGVVQGYAIERVASAREALQALMTIHGFDAFESAGKLVFRMRLRGADHLLEAESLVAGRDPGEALSLTRGPRAEAAQAVRLTYVDGESDFRVGAAEAVRQGSAGAGIEETGVNMALPASMAETVAARMLVEGEGALDGAVLALPPSRLDVEPGDVVRIGGQNGTWRVDRAVRGAESELTLTRVDRGLYLPRA